MLPARLRSKWYRINNLYKIKNKSGQIVTFHPNLIQRLHKVESEGANYVYIVKPRQLGFTTDYCIDLLDDALWTPGMSCAIIAHDRETLGKIFGIVKRAYENIPDGLKPKTKTDTKNMYQFVSRYDGLPLDSEIYVALKLRGTTVQRLHVSESAYNPDRDELKMGAKQAVPIGGRISEESTGNGMDQFYDEVIAAYDKQKAGRSGPMDYRVFFYPWYQNPEYSLPGEMPEITLEDVPRYGDELKEKEKYHLTDGQLIFRRWKIDEMRKQAQGVGLNTIQQFRQEYPATLLEAFQSGVGNIFDLEQLMAMTPTDPYNPLTANRVLTAGWDQKEAQDKEDITQILESYKLIHQLGVNIWEFPVKGNKYVIGCDPSDGEGSDNTCIDVWDKEHINQVAQFYGKIRPDHTAELIKLLAEFYNKAFVGVENNMLTTMLFLTKIYDNYYTEVEIDKKTQKRTVKLGWNTNTKTRDPMIDEFIILYEDGHLGINSAITISEMKTFVKKDNGKREHSDGKHDDSLFAGMIALQMRKLEPRMGRVFTQKAF